MRPPAYRIHRDGQSRRRSGPDLGRAMVTLEAATGTGVGAAVRAVPWCVATSPWLQQEEERYGLWSACVMAKNRKWTMFQMG